MNRLLTIISLMIISTLLVNAQPTSTRSAETATIFTDREVYITGETIWLSAYCFDTQNNDISRVLNVELFNSDGEIFHQERLALNKGLGQGQLFVSSDIPSGAYILRAYTNWMRNFSPSEVFHKTISIINPAAPPTYLPDSITLDEVPSVEKNVNQTPQNNLVAISIASNKQTYGQREEVKIAVDYASYLTQDSIIGLTFVAYKIQQDSLQDTWDKRWPTDEHSLPINLSSSDLTKSARDFTYPAEINSPIVSGKIHQSENSSQSVQAFFPGRTSIAISAALDSAGRFLFEVPFRIENERIYFMYQGDTLSSDELEVNSPFDFEIPNYSASLFPFHEEDRTYLESLNLNIQISQLYKTYSTINGTEIEQRVTQNHFYGKPDIQYMLDDYTRFETISDLFIEYIKGVNIRSRNGKKGLYVDSDIRLPSAAYVMIDGLPINDLDFALNFDPLVVKKVDIITSMYALNDLRLSGIVSFTTYAGDFDELPIPEYLLEKTYHPIQHARAFYSPNYNDNKERLSNIPDFRTTLSWTPHLEVSASGKSEIKFFTGDDQGRYRYALFGLSRSGQEIIVDGEFEVINPRK